MDMHLIRADTSVEPHIFHYNSEQETCHIASEVSLVFSSVVSHHNLTVDIGDLTPVLAPLAQFYSALDWSQGQEKNEPTPQRINIALDMHQHK